MKTKFWHIVRWLLLSMSLLTGLSAASNNQAGLRVITTVPLLYDPPQIPVPLIRLSINGKPSALFALSSAAPFALAISQEKASELGLAAKTGWVQLQSVHLVDEQGKAVNELGIPAAYIGELNLHQIDLGLGIAGVVGSNFFAAVPVELDFRGNKLRLYNNSIQEILEVEKDRYIAIRLSRPDQGTWVHTVSVAVPSNHRVAMQVATGSWISSLAENDLKSVELAEIASKPFHFGRLDIRNEAIVSTFLGRIEWLRIDEIKVQNVPCLVKLNIEEKTSRLGVDILSLFEQVIIDYRSGYLLLSKPPGIVPARIKGFSGLTIQQDKERKLRVVEVAPRSAGERAGFRTGDEILAIDSRPMVGLTAAMAQLMLDGYAGIQQRVKIMRDGAIQELILVPESLFTFSVPKALEPQGKGTFGFSTILVEMGWSGDAKERFLLVTQITSEAARQAGLHVGDKILAINGQSEWDESRLRELLQQAEELRLTIMRPGERERREVRVKRQVSEVSPTARQ